MAAHDHDNELPPGILNAYRRGRILDDRRIGEDDRRDHDPDSFRLRWPVVAQIIAWVLGLFVIYNAMTARLTTLETQRSNDTQRMERIENKIDRLIEQRK